ncbi:CHAT domain-containing protein [Streptomyces sp. NPDC006465]|uniref:CHAT domain-containing protein n=1 Tax=Streptomyces sp. NPDC006465 TaxID=3157174 RepID=UPI0033B5A874
MWRICAARSWGRHAARNNDWPQAAECFALAVSILPLITPHYLQRGGQDQGLSQLTGLASDAAASALNAGDIDRAVQLLEQARSWLLAQALESHSDFTELHKRAPKLADRLTRLREKLDAPQAGHAGNETALAGQLSHLDPKASRRMMEARTEVATSWNQLITRIRNTLPEFKNFLHPPILPELLESASSGPLVLINISDYRSDAFILTSQEVDTVPLPGLTPERIGEETSRFLDALQIIHDPKCTHAQMVRAQGEIHPILEWLWDTATGPILDRLDLTSTPGADQEWPRIWWSPSGLLTYLPPHAAGYHQDDRYPARTVLDRVVSSYTPTVRALQYARNHQQAPLDGAQILVVAMPQTAGAPDLPGARAEADLVRGMFSALELSGPQATHDSVRDSLGSHFFAHFACHGLSDCNDPSHSHLLLHDHQSNPLTVLDISRLRLPDSRLAYLSACDTARTVVDEVDHITAAFQLAGYTHVIGALWPINDITSVEIAKTVYQKLSRKSSEALAVEETAAALHSAIRSVRNRYPKAPSLWAAHIHAGP